jgi:hypothetical protein
MAGNNSSFTSPLMSVDSRYHSRSRNSGLSHYCGGSCSSNDDNGNGVDMDNGFRQQSISGIIETKHAAACLSPQDATLTQKGEKDAAGSLVLGDQAEAAAEAAKTDLPRSTTV